MPTDDPGGERKLSKTATRLVELRGKATQGEIAKIAGASTSSISNWESDIHSPPADAIVRLATHWGVSVEYLLGLSDFRSGLAPDSWLVDLDALEAGKPSEKWAAKVPRRFRIVDYDELVNLKNAAEKRRKKGGTDGVS